MGVWKNIVKNVMRYIVIGVTGPVGALGIATRVVVIITGKVSLRRIERVISINVSNVG
jgi:hypothetical protein